MESLNTGPPLWPGRFSKASGQGFGITGKDGVAMSLELFYDGSRKVKTVPEPRRLVEKTLEVRFVVAGCPDVEPQAPHLQRRRDSAGDERIKTDDLDTGNWSSLNNGFQPMTIQSSALPLLQAVLGSVSRAATQRPEAACHSLASSAALHEMADDPRRFLYGQLCPHEAL